jgi:hypothetical protein
MEPIQEAINEIESRAPGASFSYRQISKKYGVDRTTLSRRHQGIRRSNAAAHEQQQLLNPQQEEELVRYIEKCTRRGLPPTREMVKNFAETIAKREPSDSWVTRFLHRQNNDLLTKWTTNIDRNRHQADSYSKYRLYFDLLHSKMREYNVDARNTYNMDEKGFFVGIATRTKRVFSKAAYLSKERTAAIQDGNREWVTLLACVCASGDALPPALVYQGKSGIQSSWTDAVEVGKHQVFFSNSPTGWSNNDIGMAWVEQVFDRHTKAKARRQWRLLILDGHGSHVTQDFIDFCDSNRILLSIFPPHSTHSLQPLDVVLFSPLSRNYTYELNTFTHRSQGLASTTKRDYFTNFWAAWLATMKPELILKSFQATGVWPMDAEVILQRFNNHTLEQDEASGLGQHGDGDSYRELRKLYDAAVPDKSAVEAQQLKASLHSLQVQNELLHYENDGLHDTIEHKHKHGKKRKPLDLQQRQEWHGGAVFWSPRKIREARAREAIKQHEAELEKLQKSHDRELKAAATLYKKQQAAAAKEAREIEKKERKIKAQAKAVELAAARALKKQQREAATSQISRDTLNKDKRKASRTPAKNPTKRRRVVGARSSVAPAPEPPAAPPKTTRTRSIRPPNKYSE